MTGDLTSDLCLTSDHDAEYSPLDFASLTWPVNKQKKQKKASLHKGPGEKPLPRGHPKYTDLRDLSQSWAALYKQALHDLKYWQVHTNTFAASTKHVSCAI